MAKSLNETELSGASGGVINHVTSGTIAGVDISKMKGNKAYVVSGTDAKGKEIPQTVFEDSAKGLAAAEQFCKEHGISADLTDSAGAAKKTTLGLS